MVRWWPCSKILKAHHVAMGGGGLHHVSGGVHLNMGGKLFKLFVHTTNAIEPPTNSNFAVFGGPWHRLDGPSGHSVGPHGCSSTRIVTK